MNSEIKQRIEQINRGEVPQGYKKTKIGIIPNEWKIKKISDVCKNIYAGATPSTKIAEYWNGNIPWLSSGEINKKIIYNSNKFITKEGYESSSTKLIPKNSVLIALAGQGKTRGTVAINKIELCTNQSLAAIVTKNFYYKFLYYYLDSRYLDLRFLSSGDGSRGGLNLQLISNYKVFIPNFVEQQKIADILSTQDRVIELKEKLIEEKKKQKKYLMQNLLTGKIRLNGFDDEWKLVKLEEVLTETKQKNLNEDLLICSVAVKKGVVSQVEHLGRSYAATNTSNYNVVSYGDIVYTKSPTGDFPYGIIKQSHLYDDVAVSPLYGVFKPINYALGYILNCYFEYPLNANNYLIPIVQKGAKNTINISNTTFLSNKLYLPMNEKEQTAIAEIFTTADKEIELLEQELEEEKLKKKSLMQLLLTGIVRVN